MIIVNLLFNLVHKKTYIQNHHKLDLWKNSSQEKKKEMVIDVIKYTERFNSDAWGKH